MTCWRGGHVGILCGKTVLGGLGNVGDNVSDVPGGSYRGVSVRAFDPDARQWLSWWLDGRNPSTIASPVRGGFEKGVGTFIGDDVFDGKPIKVRLFHASRRSGSYDAGTLLPSSVNAPGQDAYAPMLDWSRPDHFTFSSQRPQIGAGSVDLYLIRYRLKR